MATSRTSSRRISLVRLDACHGGGEGAVSSTTGERGSRAAHDRGSTGLRLRCWHGHRVGARGSGATSSTQHLGGVELPQSRLPSSALTPFGRVDASQVGAATHRQRDLGPRRLLSPFLLALPHCPCRAVCRSRRERWLPPLLRGSATAAASRAHATVSVPNYGSSRSFGTSIHRPRRRRRRPVKGPPSAHEDALSTHAYGESTWPCARRAAASFLSFESLHLGLLRLEPYRRPHSMLARSVRSSTRSPSRSDSSGCALIHWLTIACLQLDNSGA